VLRFSAIHRKLAFVMETKGKEEGRELRPTRTGKANEETVRKQTTILVNLLATVIRTNNGGLLRTSAR